MSHASSIEGGRRDEELAAQEALFPRVAAVASGLALYDQPK